MVLAVTVTLTLRLIMATRSQGPEEKVLFHLLIQTFLLIYKVRTLSTSAFIINIASASS